MHQNFLKGFDKSYQITAKELVTLSCCNALSANEIYIRVVQDKNKAELVTSEQDENALENNIFETIYSLGFHISQKVAEISDILHITVITEERDVISFANSKDVFSRQTTLEFSLTVTSFSMKEKWNFNRKKKPNGWIDFQSNYLPEQLAFFWMQRSSQHTTAILRQTCVLTQQQK